MVLINVLPLFIVIVVSFLSMDEVAAFSKAAITFFVKGMTLLCLIRSVAFLIDL